MYKKVSFFILVALVLSMSIVGALSGVPHSHGDDFDHSKHQTCPFYQASLQKVDADYQAIFELLLILACLYFLVFHPYSLSSHLHSLASSRAPPVFSTL